MVGSRSSGTALCRRGLIPSFLLLFGTGCLFRPDPLIPACTSPSESAHGAFLCAAPESFLVLGDQDSYVWPTLLQDLLDQHAGRAALHHVLNGSFAASGILSWIHAENAPALRSLTENYLSPHPRLLAAAPAPRTALCIVSLAGLGGQRGPLKSSNDRAGAEQGADAFERLARALHAAGVERVAFATPFYVHGAGPEIGLEYVALERLLARRLAFVVAGPDLFRTSRRYFPGAFEQDGAPNEFGIKLIAEEWYRWLAGPEAREEAVEALYARDYDVAAIEASFARARNLALP